MNTKLKSVMRALLSPTSFVFYLIGFIATIFGGWAGFVGFVIGMGIVACIYGVGWLLQIITNWHDRTFDDNDDNRY